METNSSESAIEEFRKSKHIFLRFMESAVSYFNLEPSLNSQTPPILHSVKYRLKDEEHLRKKIARIEERDRETISEQNIFDKITDIAGIRILHLYQDQLKTIDHFIRGIVDKGDWQFHEQPIAYSWDPESKKFFEELKMRVEIKESYYTSIHYVIRPANDEKVKCEIQVRTLFEEIWGEIDHTLNYPEESNSVVTKEQLRVLSRLISTGTRLADSIFRLAKSVER